MKREKNIGTFIEFKIKNQEETIKGVLIDYSDEWTVLYNNPVDFILDGIVLIKNSEIEEYKSHSPASLRMNIFNKKLIHLKQQKLDIGSSEKLFSSLFNKKNYGFN